MHPVFIRDPGGKCHEPLSFPVSALTPPRLPLSINHSLFPVLKWQAGASDLEERGEWVVLPHRSKTPRLWASSRSLFSLS